MLRIPSVAAVLLATLSICASPALAVPHAPALGPARDVVRARAAAGGPTVSRVLLTLLRGGAITASAYHQYFTTYTAAKHSLSRLSGTRRSELGAVISNLQAIAGGGGLSASRAPVLFLTLERNRVWWTTEPLLPANERVGFPDSKLVWQYYPGQGIQIQWLASFGKANGYYNSGHENNNMRQLLGEAIPLASARAGGIAWEYLFHFDGGNPPWTSGLSQGTALQALSRAYARFKEPLYLEAARQALGIFNRATPQGVRVPTKAGAEYAEYTFAPGDKILNGFIQALVGLYDYTSITKDPAGLALFEAGDAEARAEVPHYDTGAWSLYDQFGESNLNYHELLTEFLQHLCERTRRGAPLLAPSPPAPGTGTTPTTPTTTAPPSGGTPPTAGSAARGAAITTPIPGDAIYCTTAEQFTRYERTPPVVSLLSTRLAAGTRAGVKISLSKISTVTLTIRRGSTVVWRNRATVAAGQPKLLWVTPRKAGSFNITVTASDLAGNFSTANGSIAVSRK